MYSLSPPSAYTFLTWTCLQTQLEKAEEEQNTLQARLLNSEEELDKSKRKSLTLEERLNRFSVTLDGIEITDMDPIINQLSRSRSFAFPPVSHAVEISCDIKSQTQIHRNKLRKGAHG